MNTDKTTLINEILRFDCYWTQIKCRIALVEYERFMNVEFEYKTNVRADWVNCLEMIDPEIFAYFMNQKITYDIRHWKKRQELQEIEFRMNFPRLSMYPEHIDRFREEPFEYNNQLESRKIEDVIKPYRSRQWFLPLVLDFEKLYGESYQVYMDMYENYDGWIETDMIHRMSRNYQYELLVEFVSKNWFIKQQYN